MIEWTDRDSLIQRARALVRPTSVVLDIGCGVRPQTLVDRPQVLVCIEPHHEYARILRDRFEGTTTIVVAGTVPACLESLPSGSVDTVFLLDVIEHLDRPMGERTLAECVRVAREQVVLFTPLGFMPQEEADGLDGWGLHGTHWQAHRSGWEPADFSGPGWRVIACRDFHLVNGQGKPFDPPFGAFWAIHDLRRDGQPTRQDGGVDVVGSGLLQREADVLDQEISLRKREDALARREAAAEAARLKNRIARWCRFVAARFGGDGGS